MIDFELIPIAVNLHPDAADPLHGAPQPPRWHRVTITAHADPDPEDPYGRYDLEVHHHPDCPYLERTAGEDTYRDYQCQEEWELFEGEAADDVADGVPAGESRDREIRGWSTTDSWSGEHDSGLDVREVPGE